MLIKENNISATYLKKNYVAAYLMTYIMFSFITCLKPHKIINRYIQIRNNPTHIMNTKVI